MSACEALRADPDPFAVGFAELRILALPGHVRGLALVMVDAVTLCAALGCGAAGNAGLAAIDADEIEFADHGRDGAVSALSAQRTARDSWVARCDPTIGTAAASKAAQSARPWSLPSSRSDRRRRPAPYRSDRDRGPRPRPRPDLRRYRDRARTKEERRGRVRAIRTLRHDPDCPPSMLSLFHRLARLMLDMVRSPCGVGWGGVWSARGDRSPARPAQRGVDIFSVTLV